MLKKLKNRVFGRFNDIYNISVVNWGEKAIPHSTKIEHLPLV